MKYCTNQIIYCFILVLSLGATTNYSFAQSDSTITFTQYFTQNNINPSKTENGVFYEIISSGNGQKPKSGDYAKIAYTGKLLNGDVFDKTELDEPFIFQLGYRQVIKGLEEGVMQLNIGTKARLFIPYALAYGAKGAGNSIPPRSDLIFELELQGVMTWEEYDKYLAALELKERKEFELAQENQFLQDKKDIHNFALSHKVKAKRLPNGVSYSVKKDPKGVKIKKGDIVHLFYEGFLLNDTIFDSNLTKKPLVFEVGAGKVIQGLDEAIMQFKEGGEGWIIIPSRFAYGPQQIKEDGIDIPANSSLAFKIVVSKLERK